MLAVSRTWRNSQPVSRNISRAFSATTVSSTFAPPPSNEPPTTTLYSGTSQPRPYSAYHPPPRPKRDLPRLPRRWPFVLAFSAIGVAGWAVFMTIVTNQEKMSSSVFKQVMRSSRSDPKLKEVLGDAIRPQPEWWLNGDPNITGHISTMQGNVDMSFRIRGSKGSGTVYFTSIRKEKGVPFTILRFKVIADDGTIVHVDSEPHTV
ncbi:cytochrome oxidase complex assembly protein [Moniliophthora roreri MCA 2997]|uniref:Cytochrome oxidase complex assembly protein n=2 Tax=Moniliophthora roreri TaxID=221103 RepID=V2XW23_MONRO|nr:cytochrome oxidase complex assembly protein [Moniliophthora roreri MCA 2997]KAI3612753.1 cytochrome oxidase complex assembly protein [Moniliophthora roreri]